MTKPKANLTSDGFLIVGNQAELDAALAADQNAKIEIGGALKFSLSLPAEKKPFIRLMASAKLTVKAPGAYVEALESSHVEALESSHVVARGSSHVVARESSHVVARESSHVEAWGSSHVVAWESSHVEAWGSSHVEAWGSSHVVARGSSHVEALESSHVEAWGSSHVEAWGSSHVEAWESSHVEARGSSHVEAWGSSHVEARGSSHVEAWESSHVVARESSHVVARGSSHVVAWAYVALYLFGARITAKAAGTVSVFFKYGAKCDGGHQVEMKDPETGAEWCEYYGIAPDAPFKIENIDAKILAAVEAEKIQFDMSSWHGQDCDETNWCNTTHCRAGAAICLAGKAGFDLERKYGAETAGLMIYAVSRPNKPIPDFSAGDEEAMDDIRASAAELP